MFADNNNTKEDTWSNPCSDGLPAPKIGDEIVDFNGNISVVRAIYTSTTIISK